MIRRIARASVLTVLAALLVVPALPIFACGPDFTGPILFDSTGPSIPIGDYARGRLELLQATYWHEPLYIAYRNLSGKPFTTTELKALTEPSDEQTAAAKDWVEIWKEARAKLIGQAPDTQLYNRGHGITRPLDQPDTFVEYYNCLDGAFEHAVHTLNQRVEQFGAQSPAVRDWLAAQDQVFANCSGGPGYPPKPKPAVIPIAARVEDPHVIRADRAYQIAAAQFYAGEYDAAQAAFEAIAKDSASPYSRLAPYLVARVLVRKGTLYIGEGEQGRQALAHAETRLRAILEDENSQEIHAPAERLLGFVNIRLHREQRFYELEKSLSADSASNTFRQDLIDYLWLLDRATFTNGNAAAANSVPAPNSQGPAPTEASSLKSGDMTDWIFTFQQKGDVVYQHSLQRWQETKSVHWLVAAISKAGPNDNSATDLSAAAAKITSDSPAYVTATFHRLRLLAQSGNADEARNQLDQVLAQHKLFRTSQNQFLALRMKLATNFEDFLRFSVRTSDDAQDFPNPPEGPAKPAPENALHFDADASVILTEKLPLRLLADAAKSTTLPATLRREVAIAAWTRAILAGNESIAAELVPSVRELVPEIKDDLAAYAAATDPSSRQFAATFMILRNPGFRPFVSAGYTRGNLYTVGEPRFDRIDNLHDNWWCSATPAGDENQYYGQDYYRMFIHLSSPLTQIYPDGKISSPDFLGAEDHATAAKERSQLESQPAAPNWLGKRALDYANAHPDDPRVPEILHLTVRARRYGCSDATFDNYSKPAFTLLHQRYADREWAKKTPYWFP
jgi:tetratricopeptide (TPR) repeat protein